MELFLCGDVMTGRGIDQILPHPSQPSIYEPALKTALAYVELAERVHGPVPRPAGFAYVWGDALEEMAVRAPDVRVINLETSVTTSEDAAPKGINYRMHPANVPCLVAGGIDCCALANNHVLDWGPAGLLETVSVLAGSGIAVCGAGRTIAEATLPAILETREGRRLLVFAFGSTDSGIPASCAATSTRAGVALLADLSEKSARWIEGHIRRRRTASDRVVVSLHWGSNWGYGIPAAHRSFAHQLIDSGLVDVVHGHSSHHPRGIEVYEGRLILYGCGDFINDYEGIGGQEEYRPDLVLAYFARLDNETGRLDRLEMVAFRSRQFRLERADSEESEWVRRVLTREGKEMGTAVELTDERVLSLRW